MADRQELRDLPPRRDQRRGRGKDGRRRRSTRPTRTCTATGPRTSRPSSPRSASGATDEPRTVEWHPPRSVLGASARLGGSEMASRKITRAILGCATLLALVFGALSTSQALAADMTTARPGLTRATPRTTGRAVALACAECHAPVCSPTGSKNIVFGALATSGGAAPRTTPARKTCSNVYCHGPNGTTVNWTYVDVSVVRPLTTECAHVPRLSAGASVGIRGDDLQRMSPLHRPAPTGPSTSAGGFAPQRQPRLRGERHGRLQRMPRYQQ